MYEIRIIIHQQVIKTFYPETKQKTKRIYYRYADDVDQYTLLIVDGVEFTTARAEAYLGGRATNNQYLFVGG